MCSVTGFLEHSSLLLVHLCHLPDVQNVNVFKMQLGSLSVVQTEKTPTFGSAWQPTAMSEASQESN